MKRRWMIWIGIIVFISLGAYMALRVMEMPIDSILHTNDWFYVIDQGVSDKRMSGATLSGMVNDTADQVRSEYNDSLDAIHALIEGGGGAWSKTGDYVYLTDGNDSVGIQTSTPLYPLDVNGNARVNGTFHSDTIYLGAVSGGSGYLFTIGDDLFLGDNENGYVSLESLLSGGGLFDISTTGYPTITTYYTHNPTANWNIGAEGNTSYKMRVAGSLNVTGNGYMDDFIYFKGVGGLYGSGHARIGMSGDSLVFSDEYGTYFLRDLVGGGEGGGEVDTSGNPSTSQIMVWIDPNKIVGNSNFRYETGTLKMLNETASDTGIYIYKVGGYAAVRIDHTSGSYGVNVVSAAGTTASSIIASQFGSGPELALYDGYNEIFKVSDTVHYSQFDLANEDTCALFIFGDTEATDTVSVTPKPAYQAWIDWENKYVPWKEFFNDAKSRKALPLPTSDGKTHHAMMNIFKGAPYQTEYELERINMYHDELYDKVDSLVIKVDSLILFQAKDTGSISAEIAAKDKLEYEFSIEKKVKGLSIRVSILYIICALLIFGFIYQQVEMSKMIRINKGKI